MTENLYEGMFLLDSGQIGANPDVASGEVAGILQKAGATVVADRPWQEGKLAYAIDGHKRGMHYLAYFRMNGAGMATINRACHLSEVVLRHLIIKHEPKMFDAMVQALSGHTPETVSERSTPVKTVAVVEADVDVDDEDTEV